jgi:hypothetical protein
MPRRNYFRFTFGRINSKVVAGIGETAGHREAAKGATERARLRDPRKTLGDPVENSG